MANVCRKVWNLTRTLLMERLPLVLLSTEHVPLILFAALECRVHESETAGVQGASLDAKATIKEHSHESMKAELGNVPGFHLRKSVHLRTAERRPALSSLSSAAEYVGETPLSLSATTNALRLCLEYSSRSVESLERAEMIAIPRRQSWA